MSNDAEHLLDLIGDAVARQDTAALKDHLRLLGEIWSRGDGTESSGEEIPRSDVLRLLRESLPLRDFLSLTNGHPFSHPEIYRLLDESALEMPLEEIIEVAEVLGIPPETMAPGLRLRLSSGPENRVIPWVEGFIWQRTAAEADNGTPFHTLLQEGTAAQLTNPDHDDGGLSDAVRLVGERPGAASLTLLMRYLVLLPWGEDRMATVTLLNVLAERSDAQARQSVRRALANRTTPGPFRLFLLQAFSRWSAATAACMVLEDLGQEMPIAVRVALVELLDEILPQAMERGPRIIKDLIDRVDKLETESWQREHRDRLRTVASNHLLEHADG